MFFVFFSFRYIFLFFTFRKPRWRGFHPGCGILGTGGDSEEKTLRENGQLDAPVVRTLYARLRTACPRNLLSREKRDPLPTFVG